MLRTPKLTRFNTFMFVITDVEDVLLCLDTAFANADDLGFRLVDEDEKSKPYAAAEKENFETACVYNNGDENSIDYYEINVEFHALSGDSEGVFF